MEGYNDGALYGSNNFCIMQLQDTALMPGLYTRAHQKDKVAACFTIDFRSHICWAKAYFTLEKIIFDVVCSQQLKYM